MNDVAADAVRPEHVARVLEERARVLAHIEEGTSDDEDSLLLVTFPLAGERYGVEAVLVREVQPLANRRWSLVPCTPDYIVGAVNMRGHIRPVIDVAVLLGLPPRAVGRESHVLLVEGGGDEEDNQLCIVADNQPDLTRVRTADVKRDTAAIAAGTEEYVLGVTEEMLVVLDLKRLLGNERIVVNEEA